ncbi:hypothetical protein [Photobacterium leiognathi]|uniref:hypothetical protein n=1 Tax=Photobacterium leiognathi TaxID=553611 RepID=UPI002981E746|nr:hypothetical protein [Photobacterium leiognathi]
MGFWSTVGDLAKKAGSAALDEGKGALERTKQYKAEMPSKSDAELARIAKKDRSHSPLRAGAAIQELESRGYSKDEIKYL